MSSRRYEQTDRVSWFDHELLSRKSVIVVGAGALGNWLLMHLVLNGIGTVLIIDRDFVQESDLPRSPLFHRADVGKAKAEVAADRLSSLNEDVRVLPLPADVETVGLGEFLRAHVVVGAVDSRLARMAINRQAWAAGIPYVDGGIDGESLTGTVRIFFPPAGACLECCWYPSDYRQLEVVQSCARRVREHGAPTLSTIAAAVGAVQADLTIQILLGGGPQRGKAMELRYDIAHHKVIETVLPRRRDCQFDHNIRVGGVTVLGKSGLTIGDILRLAETMRIDFRQDVVRTLVCPSCGQTRQTFIALARLRRSAQRCPRCTTPMVAAALRRNFSRTELKPFEETKIEDIGFPPAHVISIGAAGGDEKFYELPGSKLEEARRYEPVA